MDNVFNTTTLIALGAGLVAGPALGAFYSVALWKTAQRLPVAKSPTRLILGSFVLRTAVVMAGFYFISRFGHWAFLALALMGFILMKFILIRRFGLTKVT
jgi:F1F0 ATPase subunit 2